MQACTFNSARNPYIYFIQISMGILVCCSLAPARNHRAAEFMSGCNLFCAKPWLSSVSVHKNWNLISNLGNSTRQILLPMSDEHDKMSIVGHDVNLHSLATEDSHTSLMYTHVRNDKQSHRVRGRERKREREKKFILKPYYIVDVNQ